MMYGAHQILHSTITRRKTVPKHLKQAVIIPIPKGKGRDMNNKDHFSGYIAPTCDH